MSGCVEVLVGKFDFDLAQRKGEGKPPPTGSLLASRHLYLNGSKPKFLGCCERREVLIPVLWGFQKKQHKATPSPPLPPPF